MKVMSVEPALVVWILSKPMDLQNVYLLYIQLSHHSDLNIKNIQDLGIPVWMPIGLLVVFMSQGYNVWALADIDRVLCPMHIIGGIIDSKNFM